MNPGSAGSVLKAVMLVFPSKSSLTAFGFFVLSVKYFPSLKILGQVINSVKMFLKISRSLEQVVKYRNTGFSFEDGE